MCNERVQVAPAGLPAAVVQGSTNVMKHLGRRSVLLTGQVEAPTISGQGEHPPVQISITSCAGATIQYQIDDAPPVIKAGLISFELAASATVSAIARLEGHAPSAYSTLRFNLSAAPPVFCPATAVFVHQIQSLTVTTPTSNAMVYLTADGSTPAANNSLLVGPSQYLPWSKVGTTTFKAVAVVCLHNLCH